MNHHVSSFKEKSYFEVHVTALPSSLFYLATVWCDLCADSYIPFQDQQSRLCFTHINTRKTWEDIFALQAKLRLNTFTMYTHVKSLEQGITMVLQNNCFSFSIKSLHQVLVQWTPTKAWTLRMWMISTSYKQGKVRGQLTQCTPHNCLLTPYAEQWGICCYGDVNRLYWVADRVSVFILWPLSGILVSRAAREVRGKVQEWNNHMFSFVEYQ